MTNCEKFVTSLSRMCFYVFLFFILFFLILLRVRNSGGVDYSFSRRLSGFWASSALQKWFCLYQIGFAYIKSLCRFQRNSISLSGYLQIRGFWDQIWQNSFGFFLIDFGRYCLLSWVFLFEDLILVL